MYFSVEADRSSLAALNLSMQSQDANTQTFNNNQET